MKPRTGKLVSCARKIFFPVKFGRLEQPPLQHLPICSYIFPLYFPNFVRMVGRCAHGSLIVRGSSSARTTHFSVWMKPIIQEPTLVSASLGAQKMTFQPPGSYKSRFVYAGVYCIQNITSSKSHTWMSS